MKSKRFESVWDAIERTPRDAAGMKAKSALMMAIRGNVDGWSLTQSEASKRLGITQPRLNDLLRGRIDKFSLDALVDIAERSGLNVKVSVTQRAA